MLQGVMVLYEEAIPICGFLKSSPCIPSARSIARLGLRSRPCVTSELRGVILTVVL